MAELTKIFTGMEQGPEKIDANFNELGRNAKTTIYTLTNANIPTGSAGKVTSVDGYIVRLGLLVYINMHYVTASGANTTTDSAMLPIINVPAGYKSNAGQHPLTISQTGMSGNNRAYAAGLPFQVSAHGIDGNAYVAGVWNTSDDFPN